MFDRLFVICCHTRPSSCNSLQRYMYFKRRNRSNGFKTTTFSNQFIGPTANHLESLVGAVMASPSTRGLGCGWALHLVFLSLWVADPGAWLGGSAPSSSTTGIATGSPVRRHAVMSPPPELKPPVQDPQEKAKRAEWLELRPKIKVVGLEMSR